MKAVNIEIATNLSCPRRCPGCNRSCDVYPERVEEMSLDQIDRFIDQMRRAKAEGRIRVKKVKLAGGESLVHSQFRAIYDHLVAALDEGLYEGLKINVSDHPDYPVPKDIPRHPKVRWLHSPPRKKKHLPYGIAPVDLGMGNKGANGCRVPWTCGLGLDYRGFAPCTAAIMIMRSFGMEHLYKQELPDDAWGLDEVCQYCIFSADKAWKDEWFRTHKGLSKYEMTASWKKALAAYEEKEGIKRRVFAIRNAPKEPTNDR